MRSRGRQAIVVAAGLLLVAGCTISRPVDGPDAAARRLYSGKCAACHRLIPPREHTGAEWSAAVDKHGEVAGMSAEQKEVLRTYLIENAGP